MGQYQHDLSEQKLFRSLNAVVEDCVNAVGVDVNTASTPLLSQVSGIGEGLAHSIVSYREEHGPFRTRAVLKKVPRLGPKAFELSAGFLRIRNGDDPLDASGVHPEAYPVVRRILAATNRQLERLIGDTSVLGQLEPEAFTDSVFGVPTVTDILRELEKPGRDPRPAYKTANFREGVETLEDLKPGMVLEGGASFILSRPNGFITASMPLAPRPEEICSSTSRASTTPAAYTRLWVISAQLSPSNWRPNPVHFFGGRSKVS